MSALLKVLVIAGKSLRRVARDRSALFFTILLPFMIILIIGLAIGGFSAREVPLGVVRHDNGPLARSLASTIAHNPSIVLRSFPNADALRRAARRGVVVAGVVIPDDYDASVRTHRTASVEFLSDPGRGFPAAIRSTVEAAVAAQATSLQAATFATTSVGGTFDRNLEQALTVQRFTPVVGVKTRTIERASHRKEINIPSGFSYTAPANLVLFVFITSIAGSAALIESRRLGIIRRMLGTPTTARTVLWGETLGRFAIAVVQSLWIVGLGVFVFGVKFGNPAAAFVVATLFALVATSFAMLIGSVLRTPEQAGSIGPPAGIAMGMLSGCMWPRFIMPASMQHLGQLFPQSWAMDAWVKLIASRGTLANIAPQLAVLAAYVVVLMPIATWRLRRAILNG